MKKTVFIALILIAGKATAQLEINRALFKKIGNKIQQTKVAFDVRVGFNNSRLTNQSNYGNLSNNSNKDYSFNAGLNTCFIFSKK